MKGHKVVVVEDDPIVATDIKHKLIDFGYEVCTTASSGEEAIEAARTHRPAVVLMDITLEGKMDGVEAAEEIRNQFAIPIVYLTAHSDPATVQRAKLTLPYGYVLKPVREVELKIALEMAVYAGSKAPQKVTASAPISHTSRTKRTDGERAEILHCLSQIEPLTKVPRPLLSAIVDDCYIREYDLLEVISIEGMKSESPDGFIVLSGRIAMLKTSLNGRELAVQLVGPKSAFGLLSSLDAHSDQLTVRAQIKSKLLHVPKRSLLYLLSEAPDLYPDFLAELSRRLNALHDMSRSLAHDRVEVRIAATLAMFLDDHADEKSTSGGEIEVSRQELANLSGTTVETAIRVTRNFEKSGILELPDHRVIRIVEPSRLRMISEGVEA